MCLVKYVLLFLAFHPPRTNAEPQFNGTLAFYNCFTKAQAQTDKNVAFTGVDVKIGATWSDKEEQIKHNIFNRYYNYTFLFVKTNRAETKIFTMDAKRWIAYGGTQLKIPKWRAWPGLYKISIHAMPKAGNLSEVKKDCYIAYKTEPPVVIISGGRRKTIDRQTPIELSGEESYDRNQQGRSRDGLQYYWTCKQKINTTFCAEEPFSTGSKFTIPAKYVEEREEFTITLNVTTRNDSIGTTGASNTTTQIIEVLRDAAQLEIECMQNCPPLSDFSDRTSTTFFQVNCITECSTINIDEYEWTIEPKKQDPSFQFDYTKNTQFGRNTNKLILLREVLPSGGYNVQVGLIKSAQKRGHAETDLIFPAPPNVKQCDIQPSSGTTLTWFKIQCSPEDEANGHLYEIYARNENDPSQIQLIVAASYLRILEEQFMLPASDRNKYFVRIINPAGAYQEISINPDVAAKLHEQATSEQVSDFITNAYGADEQSLSKQLSSPNAKDRREAKQVLRNLIDEVVLTVTDDKDVTKVVNDLKFKVVEDILKIPLESMDDVIQMGESISKLLSYNEPNATDPLLGKFATTVCKKMMNKQLEFVNQAKFPFHLAEKSGRLSNSMTQCLESNTNPNYEIVKPLEYNVTTEPPLDNAPPTITENYANYVDFNDDYYKNMELLKETTYNIVNTTSMGAKILAMTTAVGEKFAMTFGKKSATIVGKDKGKFLAKARLQSQGVTLIPPQDFVDDEHPYDILISTWSIDIMWWNPAKTNIPTDIANIEFWHSTCKEKINNFTKPAKIYFRLNKYDHTVKYIVSQTFVVPSEYTGMSDEDLNYVIQVRRISLPKGQVLYIEFYDIQKTDAFDVITTNFKFPAIEDFGASTLLTSDNSTFVRLRNEMENDVWCYVGILANKEYVTKNALSSLSYKLRFVVMSCVKWIELNNSWVLTCKQRDDEGNLSFVNCECNNFSVIAGYVQNMESFPQEILKPELELELKCTHVIFITLAVTFGIYCLMLLLALLKKPGVVYFLGDNISKHRFAYVIVIKTGGGRYAGTTSNVVIKLIGSRRSSLPHVLNYPDPKLHLLQKFGNDMFLMTTEHHLGDILEIELWVDCIGTNPDWFCKNILVYDMQLKTEWFFSVRRHLAVVKGEVYVISKSNKLDPNAKKKYFQFQNRYHTWCLWKSEDNFHYVKKLTVIFSTILTTYVFALVLHGIPEMLLKDGLDKFKYEIDALTIFVAFVSSFPAFLFHVVMAWCFRTSKLQFSKYQHKKIMSFRYTLTCWIILMMSIPISTSFLIVFGFWVPYNQSLKWLTSCIIGIVFGIFIYESIFVCFRSLLFKYEMIYHMGRKFNEIWIQTEKQRWYLYKQFGDALLRPYFQHLYKPLEREEIKIKKIVVQQRRHIISELEDLAMFGIYILVLYIVILANKDRIVMLGKLLMEDMMEGEFTRTLGFSKVESLEQIYEFINKTLIPSIQPLRWYGNFVISDPALMIDMSNKYIGIVRLRQQRVKPSICSIAEPLAFLNISCRPEVTIGAFETRTFGYGWGNWSNYLQFDRLNSIWKYSSGSQTGTFATIGEFGVYSGGGYVGYLGRTLYNSYVNFKKYLKTFWIDPRSRTLFVEFLTYNADYNLFNSIKLVFEQSASGHSVKHVEVNTVRMLLVQNEFQKITIMFFALFVIWVALLLFKQSLGVVKKYKSFYKDIWFIVDLVIIIMSIVCIGLFALRMKMIGRYLVTLEQMQHNEFLNYFYLFYLEEFLKILAATLVCIATIRLWRFLRFGMMFRILERTLSISLTPLASMFFLFWLLVTTFAMTLVLLIGNLYETLSHVGKVMRLLVTMFLKANELNLRDYVYNKTACLYISIFGVLLQIMFLIFIIIIVMAYSNAQMEFSTFSANYNVQHFVQDRLKYLPKFLKYKYTRLRAGQEEKSKVEQKHQKFIYAKSLLISTDRMLTMKIITRCMIRKIRQSFKPVPALTLFDINLMVQTLTLMLQKTSKTTEVEIFFKGRVKGKRISMIDEKRVMKEAKVVTRLLEEEERPTVDEQASLKQVYKCVKMIKRNQKTLGNCAEMMNMVLHKMRYAEVAFSNKF